MTTGKRQKHHTFLDVDFSNGESCDDLAFWSSYQNFANCFKTWVFERIIDVQVNENSSIFDSNNSAQTFWDGKPGN